VTAPITNPTANRQLGTFVIPAGFRAVINDSKLSRNEIAVLLLIAERTLNASPMNAEAALSIRYIAVQNQCVDKTAETAVKKLKELGLISQRTFPGTEKPSMMSLNYDRFRSANGMPDMPIPAVRRKAGHNPNTGSAELDADLREVQEAMKEALNGCRKKGLEDELPDSMLAARVLDEFGEADTAVAWLGDLGAKWRRKKYRPRNYGIFAKELKGFQTASLIERYNLASDQTVSVPITLPPYSRAAGLGTANKARFQDFVVGTDDSRLAAEDFLVA
jgi:hypothetical protein